MSLEVDQFGLHASPWDRWVKTNEPFKIYWPVAPIDAGVAAVFVKYAGVGYAYGAALGWILGSIGHWFRAKWRNPLASRKAVFCSECIVEALQKSHYPGSSELDPDMTTPQDLLNFFDWQEKHRDTTKAAK